MSYRSRFPIFKHYPDLVYLDSASTTHKSHSVIKAESLFYEKNYANIHRGVYDMAVTATNLYDKARTQVQRFLNASSKEEIIFTSGTTEGVNLVAQSYAMNHVQEGDNIIISAMEHHANLIPWQQVCLLRKANLCIIPMDYQGVLDMAAYEKLLNDKTKLVAVIHVSNTLGTVNPIDSIIEKAHHFNIPVLIDAAQSIVTHDWDVQRSGPDFLVFSGHKLFAPTGTGVLYIKKSIADTIPPYKTGGGMIQDVTFERTLFAPSPQKFEAGTPNIGGIIGLSAAIDFVEKIGRATIRKHINRLLDYATEQLSVIEGLEIIGTAPEKSSIISFVMTHMDKSGYIHPHDVATILASEKIAIRAGQHCTQPIMDFYDIAGTNRVSFSIYNDYTDIDRLIDGINKIKKTFR